jgi:heterodisulfide reductase subunit D
MSMERLMELKKEMLSCSRCSLCKMVPLPVALAPDYTDACPASHHFHFHGYSGSGKQIMALSMLEERIKADQVMADTVFACTTCGYCDVACKFHMDAERNLVNMAFREHLVEDGYAREGHLQALNNINLHGHYLGSLERSRGTWAEGLGLKVLPEEKADVLLFAGCSQQSDDQAADVVRKLARIMQHAAVDVGILGDTEPCCGLEAHWRGARKPFEEIAANNVQLFDTLGVSKVVVASGSCLGTFRSKYPEYASALNVEVVDATEFLIQLVENDRLKLKKPVKATVTYHDPCYLGRQGETYFKSEAGEEKLALNVMTYTDPPKKMRYGVNGCYDAPRKLLEAIPSLKFKELHRIKEYALCCGGGGGVPDIYPEMAQATTLHRLDEVLDVGAELIVTSCAKCEKQFGSVLKDASANSASQAYQNLDICDVIELVYKSAGIKE